MSNGALENKFEVKVKEMSHVQMFTAHVESVRADGEGVTDGTI